LATNQKKARRDNAHLAFVDEGGLLLTPLVRRTWAPIGQTPQLVHRARHARKVSAIGAVTISPVRRRLGTYVKLHAEESIRSPQVLQFLQQLRRHVHGPLIVLFDNLQAHRSRLVKAWATRRSDVFLEHLPGYTPDLNAVESLWSHAKCHPLANYCPCNVDELYTHAQKTFAEYRTNQQLLKGFVQHTGLPLSWKKRPYQPRAQ
jgi:transposase